MHTRLTGISIPQKHSGLFMKLRPPIAWLELNTDEYIEETDHWYIAQQLRETYPISLRGIGLSLGSADALNWQYLKKLKELKNILDPCLISDHLAWSSVNGRYFHVPFPISYSEDMLNYICARIETIQNYLQSVILIENIPHYGTIGNLAPLYQEAAFLNAIMNKTGCHLLLNIKNILLSTVQSQLETTTYLTTLSKNAVDAIQLSYVTPIEITNHHLLPYPNKHAMNDQLWSLYHLAIEILGMKPTIIEWYLDDCDDHTCQEQLSLSPILQDAFKAEMIMRKTHVSVSEPA